jgi:hypothetical protein
MIDRNHRLHGQSPGWQDISSGFGSVRKHVLVEVEDHLQLLVGWDRVRSVACNRVRSWALADTAGQTSSDYKSSIRTRTCRISNTVSKVPRQDRNLLTLMTSWYISLR